ncbi:Flp family type IVb pilin [Bosea sp. 685]|nr:Flp family type IVb pilin [Bosea sp. 685]WNJ94001.1 Flp family type IVb pilin [Bosea sp. 685]
MRASFARLVRDEAGATAIEYGLLAALICVAAIAGFTNFTDAFNRIMQLVSNVLAAAPA